MTSVVLVAQEMPQPADLDEDWLIANRWILNRVLLDDRLTAAADIRRRIPWPPKSSRWTDGTKSWTSSAAWWRS